MDAATTVQQARSAAGLSRAALATRAGVPRSTITRIEDGRVDPTVGMLRRLLGATGASLELSRRPCPALALARLADASSSIAGVESIDWTRLRATVDELTRRPDDVSAAIETPPPRSGSARLDNLLAGIAEKLADDAGLPRPPWTRSVPALTEAWDPPGTPRMVARVKASAPEQFRDRNIFLSEAELWRPPVGATR